MEKCQKLLPLLFLFCVDCMFAQAIDCSFFYVKLPTESKTTHIDEIIVTDSITIVNLSANNRINDSTYNKWLSIDPETYIKVNGERLSLIRAEGIAIAPSYTSYTKPNETIKFSLIFPSLPSDVKSFDLIENEESEWQFHSISFCTSDINKRPVSFHSLNYYASYSESLLNKHSYDLLYDINSLIGKELEQCGLTSTSEYATALFYLAICHEKREEYEKAIQYGQAIVSLYELNNWKINIALAWINGLLSDSYASLGDIDNAIKFGEKSLAQKKAIYKQESLDVALSYKKLSSYYFPTNNSKSTYYAERLFEAKTKLLDKYNPECIDAALDLCRNYFAINRYAEVINLSKLYICDTLKLIDVEMFAEFCSFLSHSYLAIGETNKSAYYANEGFEAMTARYELTDSNYPIFINYINCLPVEKQIEIEESILKNHVITENSCSVSQNLALHYYEIGKIDRAIEVQLRCIDERSRLQVIDSVKYCESLNHLAFFYFIKEDSTSCNAILRKSEVMTKNVFGTLSYEYLDVLRLQYWASIQWGKGLEHVICMEKMATAFKGLLSKEFPYLTYSERLSLWESINDWFYDEYMSNYLIGLCSATSKTNRFNAALYNNILFTKGLLLEAQILDKRNRNNNSLTKNETGCLNDLLNNSWENVKDALDSCSIAIEFVETLNHEIIALIVTNTLAYPSFEFICNSNEIDSCENYYSSEFLQVLWDRITPYCTNIKKIYVSLDGFLNNIPIESLSLNYTNAGDLPQIYRVSSTKVLGEPQKETHNKKIVLFGGIDYNTTTSSVTNVEREYSYELLPETLSEVECISDIAKTSKYDVRLYSGAKGTEDSVISLSDSNPEIIHFATHGFYWKTEQIKKSQRYRKLISIISPPGEMEDNDKSLNRSGLILSSNSSFVSGIDLENNNDGILTSYEISKLDLQNVDFVVLSSCQSGLGDITKEGVFGLQRAFKEAGVKTIMMSLWNVDDLSTKLLMVEFYKNYLAGKSKHESLRQAQQYVRDYKDENGNKLFDNPHYWAGFILLDALD